MQIGMIIHAVDKMNQTGLACHVFSDLRRLPWVVVL